MDIDNKLGELVGKVITRIDNKGDSLTFYCDDGSKLHFEHAQDCCEHVRIEDIAGDLNDLIGAPILMAEETSSEAKDGEFSQEYATWTFYKFATIKGYVTVRWLGESNGCYSTDVDMVWNWEEEKAADFVN